MSSHYSSALLKQTHAKDSIFILFVGPLINQKSHSKILLSLNFLSHYDTDNFSHTNPAKLLIEFPKDSNQNSS